MAQNHLKAWNLWLGWIIANFLGVAIVGVIRFTPLTTIPGKFVSPLLIGLPISLAQWIALRRSVRISFLWVFTISTGLILGLMAGPVLGVILQFLDDESVLLLTLLYMNIGLLIGLLQWLLLRPHFNRSLIWLLVSAAGIGVGIAVVLGTNLVDKFGIVSIILVSLVYAITTGTTLSWFSVSNRKSESLEVNAA
jgi:hypothetical protein